MRVLIAGAGIGGLSLNALLRRGGIDTDLIDHATSWNRPGHALCLFGNGQRILAALGVLGAVRSRAHEIVHYTITDASGAPVRSMDMSLLNERHGSLIQLQRGALHDVLRGIPENADLRLGVGIRAIAQSRSDVEVRFENGEVEWYDAVVGADGIRSRVRQLAFERAPGPRPFGAIGWAYIAKVPAVSLLRAEERLTAAQIEDGILEFWGADRYFGIYPLPGGLFGVYCARALRPGERALRGPERRDALLASFADFGPLVEQLLAHAPDAASIFHAPLEEVWRATWHANRVGLLGDAAHAMLPFGGMGASMAMEDALVLSEELRQHPVRRAFPRYVRRRVRRVWPVQFNARMKGIAMLRAKHIPLGVRSLQGVMRDPASFIGPYATWQERVLDALISANP
ncbi:FAD-dependent monooxygenase [Pendulispora albinea]|uniref:FAD-dependent monooxygenase n=1 Tax=Pendulispora albinea TaxID=2741071 RepID=A0ABZ2LL25_9BACT